MGSLTLAPEGGAGVKQISMFDQPTNGNNDGSMSFTFGDTSIRIVKDANGEPLFVAVDVAKALGIGNSRKALMALDDDQKSTVTTGNMREASVVTESGLYQLIFTGRKEAAKQFRRWVTDEVLPQIRRTGSYVPAPEVPKIQPPKTSIEKGTYSVAILRDQTTEAEALQRVEARREGIVALETMKAALNELKIVGKQLSYGAAINKEYTGLFGGPASELLHALKVTRLRDGLTTLQLQYLKIAEMTIEEALRRKGPMTAEQAMEIIDGIASALGRLLDSVSDPIVPRAPQLLAKTGSRKK